MILSDEVMPETKKMKTLSFVLPSNVMRQECIRQPIFVIT